MTFFRVSSRIAVAAAALFLATALAGGVTPVRAEDPAPAAPAATDAPAAETPAPTAGETPASPGEEAGAPAAEGPMAESAAAPDANPYGLSALWGQGDFVARGTLLILALMSMGSWYILITKLLDIQKIFSQANTAAEKFGPADTVKLGIAALPARNTFRAIAVDGLDAYEQHRKALHDQGIDLIEWTSQALNQSMDIFASRLQGGLAFLATVGSTAPFVGLFGTVWGIYHALIAIGVAGQASIDKVAGPVGEALIMTAIGLAVAVPAVLGYNWLARRNKAALAMARRFSTDVQTRILMGQAV
ncbi:MotA/TolQ/ExbB proton channel family protein [Parvibaculum sp.]|uniref:MotA/TolQ/ExbB proton channel family protein n=1 Tax=Parvibaculum sp. TaxID=2024848 RepID=UPI002CA56915|nr:MotA/TolQ/ExbB proton channel family protein [Parvibaculum sp.]HUD49880.1 MotA/TolQ/ExbB proton channel family protein [Parvibaculum sp.]